MTRPDPSIIDTSAGAPAAAVTSPDSPDPANAPSAPGHPAAPRHAAAADSPYLTAHQAAAYLHVTEKTLYELANAREIPAARLGGKWLFPRRLIDEWLLDQAHGGALSDRLVMAGSDDPLLWAAIEHLNAALGDQAVLAYACCGTRQGIELLAARRTQGAGIHWGPRERSATSHRALLERYAGHQEWTLVRLFEREQGVLLPPDAVATSIDALAGFDYRWAMRQAGAGAQHFLQLALFEAGFAATDCHAAATALSERQAAALVRRGDVDCAPGARAVAGEYGLGFLSLGWESFDLVVPRGVVFRRHFQALLDTLGSQPLRDLADRLGGYALSPLGKVLPLA